MMMSKFEGLMSLSSLERRSASRYYLFNFVNVFLGSVITGSALEQLDSFIHQSANAYVILKDVLFPLLLSMYVCFWQCKYICMLVAGVL
jgi:hypothetical protein